jgi:hypothetical protein
MYYNLFKFNCFNLLEYFQSKKKIEVHQKEILISTFTSKIEEHFSDFEPLFNLEHFQIRNVMNYSIKIQNIKVLKEL